MYIKGYLIEFKPNLEIRKILRKQTRKFNNKRWNKKYYKNHTEIMPNPNELLREIY